MYTTLSHNLSHLITDKYMFLSIINLFIFVYIRYAFHKDGGASKRPFLARCRALRTMVLAAPQEVIMKVLYPSQVH